MAKYGDLNPEKEMNEDLDLGMDEMEDPEMDIAAALAPFSRQEIETYLAEMPEEENLEEDLEEDEFAMADEPVPTAGSN